LKPSATMAFPDWLSMYAFQASLWPKGHPFLTYIQYSSIYDSFFILSMDSMSLDQKG
jgi:hypothetical protein